MGEHKNKLIGKTSAVYTVLASFLIGLFFAKYEFVVNFWLFVLVILLLPLISRKGYTLMFILAVAGCFLGVWRGEGYQAQLDQYEPLYESQAIFVGKIIDDPYYNKRKQTEFHLGSIVSTEGQTYTGRVQVGVYGGSDLQRGDIVKVSGKIYEGFGNRQGSMPFSEFEALGRSGSNVEKVRREYFAAVNTVLPEPQSSLGLGFLVGLRTVLPEDLLDQLSTTGLTHIVAVSGYNLTILVRYTRKYLLRFSKFIATASSAALIFGFLLVTGISPSIFRASIVSGLAFLAWYNGREIRPMMLILLGAAITAYIEPTYLWLDLGWWLSFLAFFGVLILAPLITDAIYKEREPKFLMRTIIETTSAQLFALPLIMFIFGELSLISILANMLVLPLIPLAMLLTFVAGISFMIIPALAGWIAWPAKIILTYMTDLIYVMSRIPYSQVELELSQITFLALMAYILFVTRFLYKKQGQRISGTRLIR